jgi:glycine/D-amino acid oxidase-like deaminating enzyme
MDVRDGVRVTGIGESGGRIDTILTSAGPLRADHVVLAAGAETATLCASLGIDVPVDAPPGLLVHSKPLPPILNGLVIAPELHVRQTAEGRLVAGSDFGGTDPGTDPQKAAAELFAKLKAFLKSDEGLDMDFFTIGYRPTPRDGFPIIGRVKDVGGLYVAVTHSGITLAPALGLFAAQEILQSTEEPLLSPYRLSRFA